ncbi:MAG: hypothetical protein ACJ8DI_25780 [Ktedonobacteraceae bacterium]
MAQQMNDEQRLQVLEAYNPTEHLVQIRAKDGTMKDYLPANWRLYELRLRHPHITLESEIIHMDVERNLVVVKAWIFDGKTYAESERRASAYKQGSLASLDKVETGAKARAARDFGIGTEYALDMESEDEQGNDGKPGVTLAEVKDAVKTLNLVHNLQQWQAWKKTTLGRDVPDERLTGGNLAKLKRAIDQAKQANQAA